MMENRLIMTLLVRDEEDIIESNICFHLNKGVDFIIAMDNGSVDRTADILKRYEKKGLLKYLYNPKKTYEQNVWVSDMAQMAVNDYGATHLFHCDADEFWKPKIGKSLKEIANEIKDVSGVRLINYLPPNSLTHKKFNFCNFKYFVNKPLQYPEKQDLLESSKMIFYNYPMKIITTNIYTTIGYGNHCVDTISADELVENNDLVIYHFSIRSYKHFEEKVINGGSSMENNPDKNSEICWHWRKWYKLYLEGKLKDEYLIISGERRKPIIKKAGVPYSIKYAIELNKIRSLFSQTP